MLIIGKKFIKKLIVEIPPTKANTRKIRSWTIQRTTKSVFLFFPYICHSKIDWKLLNDNRHWSVHVCKTDSTLVYWSHLNWITVNRFCLLTIARCIVPKDAATGNTLNNHNNKLMRTIWLKAYTDYELKTFLANQKRFAPSGVVLRRSAKHLTANIPLWKPYQAKEENWSHREEQPMFLQTAVWKSNLEWIILERAQYHHQLSVALYSCNSVLCLTLQ